ncbi:GRIP domain [Halocaridina rubra]|uniref:GRIP domain n=1 Tax=Halocaridina rubra TaxID=373956 RepID=A0AAN8WXH2_HALRR
MTSKRELLATIEQQREHILKYESKLKDVVRAYKGLLKEKEALEASLAALTPTGASSEESPSSADTKDGGSDTNSQHRGEPQDQTQGDKEIDDGASTSSENSVSAEDLKKKVVTLTTALTTLSSEKNRIELSFQNDKKRLLAEKDKLEKSLEEALAAKKSSESSSEEKFKDLKSRLIVAQHERDQDSQTTAVMLRELESKLASARNEREKLESSLDEARQQVKRSMTPQRPPEQYEKKITDLQNELEQVRSRLKRAEQQSEEPPLLRKIQGQMEDMRIQHREAIHQERVRAAAVEETSRDLAKAHEDRVATLEARLADLSYTVASYDRTRQEDLQAIQKLKEKVSELAQENTVLVSRLGPDTENSDTDMNALIRRLTKLKDQLIHANLNAPHPVDVESLLCGGESAHIRCQQEYDQLKEEFERYKIISRQQPMSTAGEPACKGDCGKQLEDLRQKIRNLTSAAQLAADSHAQQVLSLRQELVSQRASHENVLKRIESEHRATVASMEQQLSMQQQRSLNTLSERDSEIQRLTRQLHDLSKAPTQSGLSSYEAAAALLSQVSGGSEGPLLHHLEELARKDQEIVQLRREKKQVETTMREVQMAALVRQQAQQDSIEALEDEVERYRRNVSREGENLEYLKNVVLQYMTSSDADSRQLMLNAISAVLKFTQKETESVKKYNALWWWQPAPKTNVTSKVLRQ